MNWHDNIHVTRNDVAQKNDAPTVIQNCVVGSMIFTPNEELTGALPCASVLSELLGRFSLQDLTLDVLHLGVHR